MGKTLHGSVLLKLIPLVLIALAGIWLFDSTIIEATNPQDESPLGLVTRLAMITCWAYLGLESATIPAKDIINPKTNIPRSTVIGTFTVTLIYIIATVGIWQIISPAEIASSASPFADAASVIMGNGGELLVGIGVLISIVGALNANVIATGMISRAVAEDKLFPRAFARLNNTGAPAFGYVASSMVASVALISNYSGGLVGTYEAILLLATLTTLLPYAMSALAELVFQYRDKKSAFAVPIGQQVVAIGALMFSVIIIIGAGEQVLLWGSLLLVAGLPVYWWFRSGRARLTENPELP